jgi:diguanylate cyclase (GGDEF)-like protein
MNQKAEILIVDDEESVRKILFEVLTEDGHLVDTAENGEKALELLQRKSFSLVITDIKMPGISGMELLAMIKRRIPETQVIIITSHASLETTLEALRHGAYDYLFKPFEDLDLISAAARRAVEQVRLTRENRRLLSILKQKNAQLQKANHVLKNLACRDGLTRLHNHRYFQDFLNFEIHRSHRNQETFALIFADLDYFKQYNDSNGHLEGDNLLRQMAEILQKTIRRSDMIARYGGEEFVIILPSTSKKNACLVGEKIRRAVESYPFEGRKFQPGGKVTISVGIAGFPEDGEDRAALIQSADEAMYRAKRGGRNRVIMSGREAPIETKIHVKQMDHNMIS